MLLPPCVFANQSASFKHCKYHIFDSRALTSLLSYQSTFTMTKREHHQNRNCNAGHDRKCHTSRLLLLARGWHGSTHPGTCICIHTITETPPLLSVCLPRLPAPPCGVNFMYLETRRIPQETRYGNMCLYVCMWVYVCMYVCACICVVVSMYVSMYVGM